MTTIHSTIPSMISVNSVGSDIGVPNEKKNKKQQKMLNVVGRMASQCSEPAIIDSMDPSRPSMVRSIRNGTVPLRGGDCIFNWRGDRATLSVAWAHPTRGGLKYGLTVAHLVTSVPFWELGEPIFAFNSDIPVEWTTDGQPVYKRIQIGRVVSIDHDTDSLIFQIHDCIKIDSKGVTISPCRNPSISNNDQDVHHIEFMDHSVSSMQTDVPRHTRLLGFGAAQRIVLGRRTTVYSRSDNVRSKMKSALEEVFQRHSRSFDQNDNVTVATSDSELRDKSDCGLLFLDEQGKPCCMHITTQITRGGSFISFAVGFREVMKSHPSYFDFNQSPSSVLSSTPQAPEAPEQSRYSYLIESSDYSVVIDGTTKPWSFEDEHVRTVHTSIQTIEKRLFELSSLHNNIGLPRKKHNSLFEHWPDATGDVKSVELEQKCDEEEELSDNAKFSFETLVMPNMSDDSDDDDPPNL